MCEVLYRPARHKDLEDQCLGRHCPAGEECIQNATTVVPPSYSGDSYWIQSSQMHTISSHRRCSSHQEMVPGMFFAFIKTRKLSCSLKGSRTGVGDPVRSLYDFITCVFFMFFGKGGLVFQHPIRPLVLN